ncbi:SUMF1/EgtB/PvdO family nonheme iron enzyme [Myxococcota bacterium]|nr:SUMF1/EgtB/PvdO family nonheme iron enzyme [Myxococcota bacterium]
MLAEDYVGRVLKDIYRIDRLLGEGGPSVVFCGWDLLMEIPIAIKRLKKEATGRLIDPQRFLREARTQARLVHQNIVSIRAIIEDQDEFFIIMEYIEGRDLQSLIQRSQQTPRFSFPDTWRIFEQVLSALGYAHKEGVIHRDIKPANILVAGSLQVKLADFGLARAMQDKRLTEAGVVLGTPAYMAPEQVRSHKVDHRADIYAVGASIYETLSGATPFAHPNRPMPPFEMMRKQLYEEAPSLREKGLAIGDALDAVLRKSIAKDPEQRFASCEELREAFSQAIKEDPLWSSPPPVSASPSSSTQLYASVSPEEPAKQGASPATLIPARKRIPLRPPNESNPPKGHHEPAHPKGHYESDHPKGHYESDHPKGHHEPAHPKGHHEPAHPKGYYESTHPKGHYESTHPKSGSQPVDSNDDNASLHPKGYNEPLHSAETVSPSEGEPIDFSAQSGAPKAALSSAVSERMATGVPDRIAEPVVSEQDISPALRSAQTIEPAESAAGMLDASPSRGGPSSRPSLLPTAIVAAQAKPSSDPAQDSGRSVDPQSIAPSRSLVSPVGEGPASLLDVVESAPTAFDIPLSHEETAHPAEMIAIPSEPTDPQVGPPSSSPNRLTPRSEPTGPQFSPPSSSSNRLTPRSSGGALPIAMEDTPPLHHTRRPRKRRSSIPWGLVLLALLLILAGAGALGWGRIQSAWRRLSVQVQQKIEPRSQPSSSTPQSATTYPQEKVPDMIMIEIPEGPFWRGFGSRNDVFSYAPRERITLDRYWLDRNEVSIQQYDRCVSAGACRRIRTEQDLPEMPITRVTWEEARRFCGWAGKRLPTEAEWEKAARGIDGRRFPWGEAPLDCRRLNYRRCRLGLLPSVRAQQKEGKSPYQVYDMAGNVREWVTDCFEKEAYRYLPLHNPIKEVANCRERVVRGGSWLSSAREEWKLRTYARDNEPVWKRARDIGFRCAWSPSR